MSNPYTHVYVTRVDFMSSDTKKTDDWYEEVERQKRLANSAPELLEALKNITAHELGIQPARMLAAIAAIQKAEGKA